MSDDTWNRQPSYIKFNNIFYGEKHDYTDENGSEYPNKVQYCEGTKSPLILQDCPSDKVIRKIVPKLLSCIGSKKIYDCGENITCCLKHCNHKKIKRRCGAGKAYNSQKCLSVFHCFCIVYYTFQNRPSLD